MAGSTVKMGVDVTQFKQGMKEAENSVKTLDAALKYNEKQMKASGNAEKDFSAQANLLNAKLKEQKTIVSNAEKALKEMEKNGVKTSSAAYQDMQRKLINAQSAILDTEAAINSLGTAEQTAAQGADQLSDSVSQIGKKMSLQQVQDGLKSISGVIENAASAAWDLGKALVSSVKDAAEMADDAATMAEIYNIPLTEYLQMQALVEKGLDTSVEAILGAMSRMKKGVGADSTATMNALKDLGIGLREGNILDPYSWKTKDPSKLFWEAGQAIMALGDAYEQEEKAQALFGKSWKELRPLFNSYSDQEEYNKALEGTEINSEDTIKNLAELNDKMMELEHNFGVVKTELLGALAPALTTVSTILSDVLAEFNKYLQSEEGQEKLQELSDAVVELFSGLKDIKPGDVIDTAKDILDGVVNAFTWISENWESVVKGIEAIGFAWGAIKVTEGVTALINLASGLSGMSAGAAGAATGAGWGASFAAAALSALKAVPWVAAAMALIYPIAEETKEMGGLDVLGEGMLETAKDTFDVTKWPEKFGKAYNAGNEVSIPEAILSMFGVDLQSPEEKEAAAARKEEERKNRTAAEQERDRINLMIQGEIMQNAELSKQYAAAMEELMKGNGDAYNRIRDSVVQQLVEAGRLTQDTEGNLHVPEFKPRVYVPKTGIDMKDWNEFQENKKELEENGIEIPADLELKDAMTWAADAVKKIGVVEVPAKLTLVGPTNIMHGGGGSARDISVYEGSGMYFHANGIWSVPWDGYPAILHKGERVVPAREVGSSRNFSSNLYVESMIMNNGTDAEGLAAAMAAAQRRTMSGYGS